MDRYGRVTPNGIRIDERFTHMQLAEMIGTSRETLTKVMNELRDGGPDRRPRAAWCGCSTWTGSSGSADRVASSGSQPSADTLVGRSLDRKGRWP